MPDLPNLVTIAGVELAEVGTWETMLGTETFTPEDFAAAVAAADDPAVRSGVVRLGHVDPRFDGQPGVGRIENLRTSASGMVLLGDLVGVPAWLATIMASAYPSRSMEGWRGVTTATGSTHRFVLTGLALLGVSAPAIASLADVASLYEADRVAASVAPPAGTAVCALIPAKELPVPPTPVAASVSIEAIRDAFHDRCPPGTWAWIREVYAGVDAYVIVDDDEGNLFKVPWTEGSAGEVTFGEPERVAIAYVPAPAPDEPPDDELVLLSLSGQPVAASAPPTAPAPGQQGGSMDPIQLRTSLGLAPDATDEAVLARAAELAAASVAEPVVPAAPALPEGVTVIDDAVLDGLKVAAAAGTAALERQRRDDRDRFLASAVSAGKIPPARVAHWSGLLDHDPDGTREFITALAAGAVPLTEVGHAGAGETTEDDALYASLYPTAAPAGKEA